MNCDVASVCGGVLPSIFRGTGSDFPCKVQWSTSMTSLGIEFQSLSDRCTVDPGGLV